MKAAAGLLVLLLPLTSVGEERLSNEQWLDALLRAEREQNRQPDTAGPRPFSQSDHPAPLRLPFMPLPADWRLVESRIKGKEETWVWQQKWGRAHREFTLTRAPVVTETPLAVRHSLHHNSTVLRCLEAKETPLRRDRIGELDRWQWRAHCMEKHGGRLEQQFLLLRGNAHRYDLILEWHDKAPGNDERARWQQHFDAVRACHEPHDCDPTD